MIDTNELRRLAQEATSGEWYVEQGNHIYGRKKVTDGEEEWHPLIACTDDDEVNVNFEANASFIAAANPAAIIELLDRLEEAEKSADWHKRVWMALQMHQTKMREPERTMVCYILANGEPMHPAVAGDRYAIKDTQEKAK